MQLAAAGYAWSGPQSACNGLSAASGLCQHSVKGPGCQHLQLVHGVKQRDHGCRTLQAAGLIPDPVAAPRVQRMQQHQQCSCIRSPCSAAIRPGRGPAACGRLHQHRSTAPQAQIEITGAPAVRMADAVLQTGQPAARGFTSCLTIPAARPSRLTVCHSCLLPVWIHAHSIGEGSYWVVLEPLAHLLAVRSQHQAIADQVLEGWPVKQQRGQDHEGVEPAPRLVQACTQTRALYAAGLPLKYMRCSWSHSWSNSTWALLLVLHSSCACSW